MFDIGKPEIDAITRVIRSKKLSRFQSGKVGETAQFERDFAKFIGVKYSFAINSGTSALTCALVALGVGPGDEVPVSAYTWITTALAPMILGAIPVLVEVDESLTMDPKDLARKISKKTKAVIPVHMNNLPCNMDEIMRITKAAGVPIVEDACQAVGGMYKGRRLGSFGAINAFSFNCYKNITCGEGGGFVTDDEELFDRARIYSDAGIFVQEVDRPVEIPHFAGQAFRISDIQGAMLNAQLKQLDAWMTQWRDRRNRAAKILVDRGFTIAKHHDPETAVGLPVQFKTVEEAKAFADRNGFHQFINTWRHVYTNWKPIVDRQTYRPDINPLTTPAGKKFKYGPDAAPKTLDILARTVNATPLWNMPIAALVKKYKSIQ